MWSAEVITKLLRQETFSKGNGETVVSEGNGYTGHFPLLSSLKGRHPGLSGPFGTTPDFRYNRTREGPTDENHFPSSYLPEPSTQNPPRKVVGDTLPILGHKTDDGGGLLGSPS